ncbi:patatin-like phospholipase family protein [Lysinibacillus sphaericus]|uniref:Alpha/beta hydrolase n=1 Tax=Lysinibacillus sphaericus OT4b.31 TaxID=1285586 RepID=R7Z8R3_LYSSH|nr:patatin family protein [Lysinibacillus sphaericus]EON70522.1 alpha/beta hydrolase [Lysinibacillus sphaericus OT4b.31]
MLQVNVENASLILEGGTFRTLFTSGVLDAFLEHDIMMPYVVAISAGAINACSYVSQQKERSLRVLMDYRHDKRYMGLKNFLKEKSLFGLDFAYNVIPNQLDIFDWATYQQYQGKLLFGVTNATTGQVEYMDAREMDRQCTMLRATCAIPILFPEIKLNDTAYYDGGLAEPIPIQHGIERGFDKHVLVLTRPKGYRKKLDRQSKWAMRLLAKRYPNLVKSMEKRADHYNASLARCEQLEEEGRAFIFRPTEALNSFEKDTTQMRSNYEMGYEQALQQMAALKQFLK